MERTSQIYDVIVVGAGPAGATAAARMAAQGLRVALLDKSAFPRDKICGDAISGKSVDVLRKLGLLGALAQAESLDSWGCIFGGPYGDAVEIPFGSGTQRPNAPGFICARTTFDALLVEAAVAAGAELRTGVTVEDLLYEGDQVIGVRVKEEAGRLGRGEAGRIEAARVEAEAPAAPANPQSKIQNLKSKIVIGADGAYSVVARKLGMDQLDEHHYFAGVRGYYEGVTGFHPRNYIELHFVEEVIPGYFWIFPMAGGRANVGLGTLSAHVKRRDLRLKAVLDEVVALPRFRDRFADARRVGPVKGWGLPLGSKMRPMAGNGWMLVGDAASLIDPFSGEGIGNAMVSGDVAADWAAKAVASGDASSAVLAGYEQAVRSLLTRELRLSHTMQRLGNWKWLLNTVIRKAGRSPELARAITGMFDSLEDRQQLASPLFYLRVLAA